MVRYNNTIGQEIYELRESGAIFSEIAEVFDIAISTAYNYYNMYVESAISSDEDNDCCTCNCGGKCKSHNNIDMSQFFDGDYDLLQGESLHIYPASDFHIGSGNCNFELLDDWFNRFEDDNMPKIILGLGDYLEIGSKSVGNSSFTQEFNVNKQMEVLLDYLKPFKKNIVGMVSGNHCFTETSEILTVDGWKYGNELLVTDLVASVNEANEIEYVPIDEFIYNYIEDDILSYEGKSLSFEMTKEHRFINLSKVNREIATIDNIGKHCFDTLVAGVNNKDSLGVPEDILKLYAWCLTDSHYHGNFITFYQSGEEHKRILSILDNLNLEYKVRARDRDIKSVCGIELKSKAKVAYEISVRLDEVYNLDYDMPSGHADILPWLYELSVDEFNIFLEELVFCDGNSRNGMSGNLYGSKEDLEAYQLLCLHYGIRTKLKYVVRNDGKPNHYRLSYSKQNKFCVDKDKIVSKPYKGYIYCVSNCNGTIITRHNGTVLISGNSSNRMVKDYDFDIDLEIARSLGTTCKSRDTKKFLINGEEYSIYFTHGKGSLSKGELGLSKLIRDNNSSEASLILNGHTHISCYGSKVIDKGCGEYMRRYYAYCGSMLKFENSYGDIAGYSPLLSSYIRVNVNNRLATSVDIFNEDEVL